MIISDVVQISDIKGKTFKNIKLVGARAGKGKTQYSILEALKALDKCESVGFITFEETSNEICKRFLNTRKQSEPVCNLSADKLIIANNFNSFELSDLIYKMNEMKHTMGNLDCLIIDSLKYSNFNELMEILNNVNDEASTLNTTVLITIQLNRNNELSLKY